MVRYESSKYDHTSCLREGKDRQRGKTASSKIMSLRRAVASVPKPKPHRHPIAKTTNCCHIPSIKATD